MTKDNNKFDLEAAYHRNTRKNFKIEQPKLSDIITWIRGDILPDSVLDQIQSLWVHNKNFKENTTAMIEDLSVSSFSQVAAASTNNVEIKRECNNGYFTIILKPTKKSSDLYWLMIKSIGTHSNITSLSCQSEDGIHSYKLPEMMKAEDNQWQGKIPSDHKIIDFIKDINSIIHLHSD